MTTKELIEEAKALAKGNIKKSDRPGFLSVIWIGDKKKVYIGSLSYGLFYAGFFREFRNKGHYDKHPLEFFLENKGQKLIQLLTV